MVQQGRLEWLQQRTHNPYNGVSIPPPATNETVRNRSGCISPKSRGGLPGMATGHVRDDVRHHDREGEMWP